MASGTSQGSSHSQQDELGLSAQSQPFSYDDGIVRLFVMATLFWGLAATAGGLLVGILLVAPEIFEANDRLGFGRMRPVHTNLGVFAFVGNALFAAVYYSTQRLCKAGMWSRALSWLHFLSWQGIIVAGSVTLPMGITQGKEFAEWEWPIDLAIAVSWIGFFGVNFFMTLAHRRERHLYISLWFYIATIVVVSVAHVLNSLVLPMGLGKSLPLYAGVQDAIVQWFYGQNMIAFFMTMPFLGLMYYFIPKATSRPIHSYKLAIVHFWALVLLYVWLGPHHLHYTAAPQWITTIATIAGLLLWLPMWAGLLNGWMTLRGGAKETDGQSNAVTLKFFTVGLVSYAWLAIEGPMLSLQSASACAQYTDWGIASIHVIALGWCGMMTFGMIYWLLPRLFQTQLWSCKAVSFHYGLSVLGILLSVVPIYLAGFAQSAMWFSMDDVGNLTSLEFADSIAAVKWMWHLRLLGGVFFIAGMVLMAVNTAMTWARRPKSYKVLVHQPPTYQVSEVRPGGASELDDVPVLQAAKKLDVFSRLDWHRGWERATGNFVRVILAVVAIAGVFQLVPVFLIRGSVPIVDTVKSYTPLELAGRDIYVAEGCFNCHSQMIRPLVAETSRYGEFSAADEFAFDRPFQWGSRRIGPDLAREGGKNSSSWHWFHLDNPRGEQGDKNSVMPSFVHLLDRELNFSSIPQRVETAHRLGAPYTKAELQKSVSMARRQAEEIAAEIVAGGGPIRRGGLMTYDSQAVALIAYLQRLGTDRFATPEPQSAEQEKEEN